VDFVGSEMLTPKIIASLEKTTEIAHWQMQKQSIVIEAMIFCEIFVCEF
jgi:hypothetical protein